MIKGNKYMKLISNIVYGAFALLVASFVLLPQIVVPAPDGDYSNDNLTTDEPSTYEPYSFTTFAGLPPGSADGTGSAARFNSPTGVARDSAGNTYVADTVNSTIRKITPAGVVTTFAGLAGSTGSANGTGSAARFNAPGAVAIDSVGNIFVADTNNSTIRKITPAGVVSTFAGLAGSTGGANGTGSAARFYFPGGLAIDTANNIYVADTGNSTIRKITPARVVSTFAGLAGSIGTADGIGSAARFNFPGGVAVDRAHTGNIYVGDTSNFTIRQITPARVVTTLAGSPLMRGGANGTGSAARFFFPTGMAVDSAGNIYVADADACTIRKIAPGGVVSTFAGSFARGAGSQDGTGSAARFNIPTDVAVDSSNNLYVADSNNCTIRKITPAAVVTTLAGLASPGHTNGTGSAARFDFPQGVAVDTTGKVYVADPVESAIRKITPSAVVSTFAGSPGTSGYVDATGTAARFRFPRLGLTVGAFDNVYVGDTFNFVVRKITPNAVVSSVVTNPANGAGEVRGVAIDSSGNIYTADYPHHTIRKITPDGTASIFAGLNDTPGSANGIGSAARFNFPLGLAVDGAGNVYVADSGNNRIRKITPAGGVTTFAGSAVGSADGTGTAARFNFPSGVAVDHSGNVFVTDAGNNTIRKITPARVVTTLGGLALSPGTSDGVGINARFNSPRGIAVDSAGNIYVVDTANHTIRLGTP
jgi:sugar lactone lactonase YvrE